GCLSLRSHAATNPGFTSVGHLADMDATLARTTTTSPGRNLRGTDHVGQTRLPPPRPAPSRNRKRRRHQTRWQGDGRPGTAYTTTRHWVIYGRRGGIIGVPDSRSRY